MSGPDNPAAVTWIADVPLLTNPVMLRAAAAVFVLAYGLIALIGAGVLLGDGHPERIPAFLGAMLMGFGIVALLMLFVTLVIFGNRMRCRFIVDEDGITTIVVDRRAALGGSLAILAGSASGNATLTGAGLTSSASRREFMSWKRIGGAVFDRDRHVIRFTPSGWWPVGAIHCTAESWPAVEAAVRAILARRKIPVPVTQDAGS